MTELFQNILTASFHGSVVIVAVLCLRLILKKTPKKFLCLLWLLAGIRLLMPFEIQSDLSLQPDVEPVSQIQWQQPEAFEQIPEEPVRTTAPATPTIHQAQPESAASLPGISAQPQTLEGSSPKVEITVTRSVHWYTVLPYLWLTVASFFAIYSIYSYIHLRLKVRTAIKIPGGWECEHIDTAFILGFIRPRIYIPMGMSKSVRRHILAHERTHLEKGDHWFKMIGFIALALHWFNPLVWVAYILLCKDIEMACDERVVQFMDLEERKSYSAALLSCSTNRAHFAACPVAFGEVSVKYRIKSVLKYKKPSFWISLAGVIAILFVAVCLVTSPTEKAAAAGDQTAAAATEPETLEENREDTQLQLVSDAFDDLLSQDNYHLFFSEEDNNGGVGWQIHFYKDGDNTLWWSTDHQNEEGRMVLDGVSYAYINGSTSGWVPYDSEDTQLESILAEFSMEGAEVRDILMEELTGFDGIPYQKLTFTREHVGTDGNKIVQPVSVFFNTDGLMTGMRIENTTRKGADIFSFSNWSGDGDTESRFQNARENLLSAEEADLTQLLPPTEDEQRMKDWGIQFRVEDDILTRSGSEAWFCLADGYDYVISTNNEYWLEKKTENGWEKLEMIAEPQWNPASYTLGHGMYTMVAVDWSQLYGPLDGGIYRMGKTFTKMEGGGQSCTGYAEFEIFYQAPQTMAQADTLALCRNAVEELKSREFGHFKYTSSETVEEVCWNGSDYLSIREWTMPDTDKIVAPIEDPADIPYVTHKAISVRKDGIGYNAVYETPDDIASPIVGTEVSNLNAGSQRDYNFKESLYLSSFEESNQIIDFSASDCIISTEKVSYHQYWSDPNEYTKVTYWFGADGKITQMQAEYHFFDLNGFTQTYRIFDTSAEDIDAAIQPYTQNLMTTPFSWEEAKGKYTDGTFNIRENSFVNNDMVTISTPVEAAQRALKEYPNLKDYLDLDVGFDESAKMWRVTVRSYYEYQSSEEFRDIYLDSNGVTHLLVYEGPIEWDEARR